MRVLDCTFRDGGYYNKWDFDTALVRKYIKGVVSANIDAIELGFRNFPQHEFFGALFYTTDSYLDSLDIDQNITVGVMINACSVLERSEPVKDSIGTLFKPKDNSRVDLVRIAAHFHEVESCKEIAQELKFLGYQVVLNLMQLNDMPDNKLSEAAKSIQSWNVISTLYFADSLGCMDRRDIRRISSALKLEWKGQIGFHAHDNKGFALSNSIDALEAGTQWIDCTILGMGRGAGNVQTECLIMELLQKHKVGYKLDPIYELSLDVFFKLKQKYSWGENIFYALAANYNIHPTYIQEMLSGDRYGYKEILRSINFMEQLDARHYDQNLLLQAKEYNNQGAWSAKFWCAERDVLILGSGESLKVYQEGIIEYIRQHRPIVISLDVKQELLKDLVDIYVSSNESKMLDEFKCYPQLKKPLVASSALLFSVVEENISIDELWDYGLSIKKGVFRIEEYGCTLPYELSIGYALSFASMGGASKIALVGFDGFSKEDVRQEQMEEIFDLYNRLESRAEIIALTPTTYNIPKGSIYAQ